jgi:hypothetical protein
MLDETAQHHVELVLNIPFDKVLQLWAAVCLEQLRLADDAFRLLVTLDVGRRPQRVWQVGRCDESGVAVIRTSAVARQTTGIRASAVRRRWSRSVALRESASAVRLGQMWPGEC